MKVSHTGLERHEGEEMTEFGFTLELTTLMWDYKLASQIICESVKHGEGIAKKLLIEDGVVQNYNYTPQPSHK